LDETDLTLPNRWNGETAGGLYVHVPFCFHKCHYCDFYSITRQPRERMSGYVSRILREADQWEGKGVDFGFETVFFGGGTPTLLPLEEMRRLILGLKERFDLSKVKEWTVECNPATANADYCAMLAENSVNRMSFGAQSFNVEELKTLDRMHDPADVAKSIRIARNAGIKRMNVDLILAICGQSIESLRDSLKKAMDLGTGHISCYALTYEENTVIAVRKRLGRLTPASEELELAMLKEARRMLQEGGYEAYEISNFAKPGERCAHNMNYWDGGNYIALGPAGASHISGWRWRNERHLGHWETGVDKDGWATEEVEHLSEHQRAGEYVMLRLRLMDGVNLGDYEKRWGRSLTEKSGRIIERLITLGLVEMNQGRVTLSDRGVEVADSVSGELIGS
jgi:oxygen-independent coproporphyrinogen III oxidase